MAATYDRRVDADFLALFTTTVDGEPGPASSLVTYAKRALYPVDFHLRRSRSGKDHATLYVGLTAVLNVRAAAAGSVRLDVHPTHQKNGRFDPAWSAPRPVEQLGKIWPQVELYLDRVIPVAAASHGSKEGAVQAAVSRGLASGIHVLDREVTPSYEDKQEKQRVMEWCAAPILRALASADLAFGGSPHKLGNECDILALDRTGRLLAIEVKPLGVGSIAWVAAQAAMYARMLQAWVDEQVEASGRGPVDTLEQLLAERQTLGLIDGPLPPIAEPVDVVPVVALQRGASPEMVRRMVAVRDVLDRADLGLPAIEIYEVNLLGDLLPLDVSRLPDGRPRKSYSTIENARMIAWKGAVESPLPDAARAPGQVKNRSGQFVDVDHALPAAYAEHNLLPEVRDAALKLFRDRRIAWHQGIDGGPTAHLRSSQVQCVNALGAMMKDPGRILGAFGDALDIATVRDFGVIDPQEAGRFLTFEFISSTDYLNESRGGKRTRGSQCTSVDAAFAYTTSRGVDEMALIEWKYTEHYPSADRSAASKLEERLRRYGSLLRAEDGPVVIDGLELGDLFHEPVYQLVRQQLLADQLERDANVDAQRVRVVHVLSPNNMAYQSAFVAPSLRDLGDVDAVWRSLLRRTDRFAKIDPKVFVDETITSAAYVARYGGPA